LGRFGSVVRSWHWRPHSAQHHRCRLEAAANVIQQR
jgi:hypothetical protein